VQRPEAFFMSSLLNNARQFWRDSIFVSPRAGMPSFSIRVLVISTALLGALLASDQKPATKEGWLEIHSAHLSVVTDAGEKRGREVALRLEQMRAVFGQLIMRDKLKIPVPFQVLALKNDNDYAGVCPLVGSRPTNTPGFFLPGEDRNLIVLNLSANEPWLAVAYPLARVLLDGNYPPTQAWFDEGLAEYFSSIRVDNKTVDIGGDPGVPYQGPGGNAGGAGASSKSLLELLSNSSWLDMHDLLTMRPNTSEHQEDARHAIFSAQAWIVIHYLLAKDMLPNIGAYFDLVQNQKVPVEQALQQALGMTADQLKKAVTDYFQSLKLALSAPDRLSHTPAPFGPELAMVVKKVSDDDAHAIVADVMARQPDHSEQGIKDLRSLAEDPTDNEVAHRALAYAFLQKKDFKQAEDELSQAADDDPNDPWVHYYFALLKFRKAQATGQPVESLANVQQGLKTVIDWNPELAEAYHLLGLAELEGGGTHAATDTMRTAIQLSPRNESYVLDLATIYVAGKKWDQAQAILERLKDSADPQIATSAGKKLKDLPFLKKYGIEPQRAEETAKKEQTKTAEAKQADTEGAGTESQNEEPEAKPRTPDKRRVQYLKGRIVSVDCSQAPAAMVTLSSGGRILKLHTADYKSLVVIGADEFSCEWRNRPASINYKASGKAEGDLVSLEVQ
jgi:tetratricopeptide (TPR) repeat protein